MNTDKGYIKLYRSLMEHWLFTDRPFNRLAAWIDLLLLAKFKDEIFMSNGSQIDGKRGSVYMSMLELSNRWGWGRDKVRRFLCELEKDGMVSVDTTKNKTTITIENYDDFQNAPTAHKATDTTVHTTDRTTEHRQPTEQRIGTSNKDNNVNKVNESKEGKECQEYISESKSVCAGEKTVGPDMYIDPSEYEGFEYPDDLKELLWKSKVPKEDPRYQSREDLIESILWFNGMVEEDERKEREEAQRMKEWERKVLIENGVITE